MKIHNVLNITWLIIILNFNLGSSQNEAPYTATYIMEWGNKDTIGIETFTIYKNQVYGKAINGFPENYVREFNIEYNYKTGSIKELNYLYKDIANTSLPIDTKTGYLPHRFSAKLYHDLLDFRILEKPNQEDELGTKNRTEDYSRIIHKTENYHFNGDWIPIIAQFEWLVSWFNQQDKEKVEGLKFINAYIGPHDLKLEKVNKNHIRFWSNISEAIEIYLDDIGRIKSIDAIGSVWNLNIYRTDPVDIEKYTHKYKNRPTIGNPSPHETISKKVGKTTITVDYGRPSKRGRTIFGNIVPYGEIWRTGAGSATTITFDHDIVIAGQNIKAGTYHIHSLPTQDTFTLILNSNLEAWGSVYLPDYDVIKAPMKLSKNQKVVEKLTIEIIPKKKDGILVLKWDKLIAYLDFDIKN